jgi:ATPase subunit of ABC transporter with duplicated ATPase domains
LGGSFKWLDGIQLNYFGQDEKIDLNLSPFDYVKTFYPDLTNTEVRSLLGAVGVQKELALRKMKELSGGEQTKARLAIMTKKKSNFLIFDEPTNHLDQKAKDALFEAIASFPGAVIIVSHEKDFYDGLVDYELNF